MQKAIELLERSKQRLELLNKSALNDVSTLKQKTILKERQPDKIDDQDPISSVKKFNTEITSIHQDYVLKQGEVASLQSKQLQSLALDQIKFIQTVQSSQLDWEKLSSFYQNCFAGTVQQVAQLSSEFASKPIIAAQEALVASGPLQSPSRTFESQKKEPLQSMNQNKRQSFEQKRAIPPILSSSDIINKMNSSPLDEFLSETSKALNNEETFHHDYSVVEKENVKTRRHYENEMIHLSSRAIDLGRLESSRDEFCKVILNSVIYNLPETHVKTTQKSSKNTKIPVSRSRVSRHNSSIKNAAAKVQSPTTPQSRVSIHPVRDAQINAINKIKPAQLKQRRSAKPDGSIFLRSTTTRPASIQALRQESPPRIVYLPSPQPIQNPSPPRIKFIPIQPSKTTSVSTAFTQTESEILIEKKDVGVTFAPEFKAAATSFSNHSEESIPTPDLKSIETTAELKDMPTRFEHTEPPRRQDDFTHLLSQSFKLPTQRNEGLGDWIKKQVLDRVLQKRLKADKPAHDEILLAACENYLDEIITHFIDFECRVVVAREFKEAQQARQDQMEAEFAEKRNLNELIEGLKIPAVDIEAVKRDEAEKAEARAQVKIAQIQLEHSKQKTLELMEEIKKRDDEERKKVQEAIRKEEQLVAEKKAAVEAQLTALAQKLEENKEEKDTESIKKDIAHAQEYRDVLVADEEKIQELKVQVEQVVEHDQKNQEQRPQILDYESDSSEVPSSFSQGQVLSQLSQGEILEKLLLLHQESQARDASSFGEISKLLVSKKASDESKTSSGDASSFGEVGKAEFTGIHYLIAASIKEAILEESSPQVLPEGEESSRPLEPSQGQLILDQNFKDQTSHHETDTSILEVSKISSVSIQPKEFEEEQKLPAGTLTSITSSDSSLVVITSEEFVADDLSRERISRSHDELSFTIDEISKI